MSKLYQANRYSREAAGAVNAIPHGEYNPAALAECIGCEANITVHYRDGNVYFEVPDYVPFLEQAYPIRDKEFCEDLLSDVDHVIEIKHAFH